MSDLKSYFARKTSGAQGSDAEKQCAAILFNDSDVHMGDSRLNSIAALTYNSVSCEAIFTLLEKAISPQDNHWKTIYKALLLLHTIILYGSELAVDKSVDLCKFVHPLRTYNSALVKKGYFFSGGGGTDYGAPVRATSTIVTDILMKDDNIRKARMDARAGANTLVPMGQQFENTNPSRGIEMSFGQGLNTSVGAGFGLQNVPGMYDGRPDRYFDNANDPRGQVVTGNSQITRDALAPSLLDLVFDVPASSQAANLPPADYLPALHRQQELERQLREQQELLRKLQEQQMQQQQQQFPPQYQPQQVYPPMPSQAPMQQQQPFGMNMSMPMQPPHAQPSGADLLGLGWPTQPSPSLPSTQHSFMPNPMPAGNSNIAGMPSQMALHGYPNQAIDMGSPMQSTPSMLPGPAMPSTPLQPLGGAWAPQMGMGMGMEAPGMPPAAMQPGGLSWQQQPQQPSMMAGIPPQHAGVNMAPTGYQLGMPGQSHHNTSSGLGNLGQPSLLDFGAPAPPAAPLGQSLHAPAPPVPPMPPAFDLPSMPPPPPPGPPSFL